MIETRLTWSGDELAGEIRLTLTTWVQRATLALWTWCVEALNVPNTGERRKSRTRKTKSGRAASYTVYPHPSRPGEPPRKRAGWGQRNVKWEVDRDGVGRVGVTQNAPYLAMLDVGTRDTEARPWLLSTAEAHADQLRAMVLEGQGS